TIGPAVEAGIPVRVLSAKEPKKIGTTIVTHPVTDIVVAGIAIKKGVILAKISSGEIAASALNLSAIFSALEAKKFVPLALALTSDNIMIALEGIDNYSELHEEIDRLATLRFLHQRALITLVGDGLSTNPGIASRLFAAMKNFNCEMISFGSLPNAIHIAIPESEVESAVGSIHREFFNS
ncbi:MAG: hypothetical protein ABI778_08885, partial [Ignavibacteriota bacterium]